MGSENSTKLARAGSEYFIKVRMSAGYVILKGIDGAKAKSKPIPKVKNLRRVQAGSSCTALQKIPFFDFSNATNEGYIKTIANATGVKPPR